jgi:hypothetical protein
MLARQALGEVLTYLGNEHLAEAARCFAEVSELARVISLRSMDAHAHVGLGRLAVLAGDRRARELHLVEARAVFVELGLRRYAERAERWLADAEPPVGFLAESA